MARAESRTNMAIWQDPDWRALPFPAQHLYKMLWEHPQLSYCGVVDWRPGRIAAMGGGLTGDLVQTLGDCLAARHFIVVDTETEEVLLRSWVRWDGLMKQPRLAVSYANAYAAVASNDLRGVMIHELHRLREREPELAGLASPRVVEMLALPAVNAKERTTPEDPFTHGFGYQFGYGFADSVTPGLGETRDQVSVPVSVPPAPAPAPTPTPRKTSSSSSDDEGAFDEWWSHYPRKVDKGHARKAYRTAAKKATTQELLDGVQQFAAACKGADPKFIAHAGTWLNGERWHDEPPPETEEVIGYGEGQWWMNGSA